MENKDISFISTIYNGKARAGKTLSMIEDGYNDFLEIKKRAYYLKRKKRLSDFEKKQLKIFEEFKIVSNLKLNKGVFGEYLYLDGNQLIKLYEENRYFENTLFLLDDIFKTFDSYNLLSKSNKIFSYFLTEIGKNSNILKCVAHTNDLVFKRLRNFSEVFCFVRKGELLDVKGTNYKVFKEFENYYLSSNKKFVIEKNYLKADTYLNVLNNEIEVVKKRYFVEYNTNPERIFRLYDTKEVIK